MGGGPAASIEYPVRQLISSKSSSLSTRWSSPIVTVRVIPTPVPLTCTVPSRDATILGARMRRAGTTRLLRSRYFSSNGVTGLDGGQPVPQNVSQRGRTQRELSLHAGGVDDERRRRACPLPRDSTGTLGAHQAGCAAISSATASGLAG